MKRLLLMILEISLLVALGFWVYHSLTQKSPIKRPGGVEVTIQLPDVGDKAVLYRGTDNQFHYAVSEHGTVKDLTPEELAQRVHTARKTRSWGQKILNVSSPLSYLWVGLGLLGQVLFTGRMIVQWIVSEKQKKSTVPPIFWWMSLVGSSMLMVYFLWRKDPIGLLGQSFGWFIYMRNLWLIYRPHAPHSDRIMEAEGKEAEAVAAVHAGQ